MFNVSIFISGFTLLLRHPMESLPSVFDSQIRSVCVHMENQPQGFWLLWVSESCRDIIKKKSQNWFLSTTWECLVIKQNPFVTAKCRAGPCGILTLACGIGWSVCCSFYCSYAVFFYAAHGEGDEMTEISECEKTNVLRRAGYHQHSVTVFCQSSVEIDMCVCVCVGPCVSVKWWDTTWPVGNQSGPASPTGRRWLSLEELLLSAFCPCCSLCVCVCFWSKEAVVVFLCRDLASGSMCPVKTNATCLWFGHSTFCTCCSIFVFAVLLVFWGGWNIEGFLAQVECLSVRECVCARVLCCAVLRVQSESKVSCKPVTVFAGVTLLPSSSSDCWVSALKQKVNSRSIHGKSVGGKISSWFALWHHCKVIVGNRTGSGAEVTVRRGKARRPCVCVKWEHNFLCLFPPLPPPLVSLWPTPLDQHP